MAARVAGARDLAIIVRHLLPSFISLPDRRSDPGDSLHDPGRDRAELPSAWDCGRRW